VLPAYDRFKSPRRNARCHKILTHQFVDCDYSIWIDGCYRLLVPPEEMVERFLMDHDIAAFKHPHRDCAYDEARDCTEQKLDNPDVIKAQVEAYRLQGFPENFGMVETMVLLRRHSARVETFNNIWWSELCRHSVRDQISFSIAARRAGVRIKQMPNEWEVVNGSTIRAGLVEVKSHLNFDCEP
jgi:hypothetical protein